MTKILYVEDNEDNIYMLTRRLKKKGFEIVVANDVDSPGEILLQSFDADGVLSDPVEV